MGLNNSSTIETPRTRDEAITDLQRLLAFNGIHVEPAEIDKLFRNHWSKLSTLAHQIHGRI